MIGKIEMRFSLLQKIKMSKNEEFEEWKNKNPAVPPIPFNFTIKNCTKRLFVTSCHL